MLNPPEEGDPNFVSTKIYFFNTPRMCEVRISKKHLVGDVIKHIMTLYMRSKELSSEPLQYPEHSEAYELRLIDDDEEYYSPFYEILPLGRTREIGEFESLAFV